MTDLTKQILTIIGILLAVLIAIALVIFQIT